MSQHRRRTIAVALAAAALLGVVLVVVVRRGGGSGSGTAAQSSASLGVGSKMFAPAGLGASVQVPSSWSAAGPRSGFDFVIEDRTDQGGFVLATRVYSFGGGDDPFRQYRQQTLTGFGAVMDPTATVTIDGHQTDVLRYQLPVPGQAVTVRDAEYDIDADDGTYIQIVIGQTEPVRDADLLAKIAATIRVGDLSTSINRTPVTISDAGFVGQLLAQPGATRRPAVLLLGGSEGGMPGMGVQLARAGYPTLAVAYFKVPGLPDHLASIPLEYFQRALQWLANRPEVDPTRIFLWGTSRGAEAALLIASTYPQLVHAVVANVPANVLNEAYLTSGPAWTLNGTPLPYAHDFPQADVVDAPEAEIPVERINGPILLTCGGMDTVWASCPMSRAIAARLQQHRHAFDDKLLEYPTLGHNVNRAPPSIFTDPRAGGDEAWHAALTFLDNNS